MRTTPNSRNRFASQIVAGLGQIRAGIFGMGSPVSGDQMVSLNAKQGATGFWAYQPGDLFTPGTGNFALDPSLEIPLQTNYGHATNYPVGVWKPLMSPQVYVQPANLAGGLFQNRVRGVIAGQIMLTPLLVANPTTPVAPTPTG